MILGIAFIVFAVALQPALADTATGPLDGRYSFIGFRQASDVAHKTNTELSAFVGKTVVFGDRLTWLGGRICASWGLSPSPTATVNFSDPILSDTQIGPVEGMRSQGDKVLNMSFDLRCNDRPIARLAVVDRRVFAVATDKGEGYALFEKVLPPQDIRRVQEKLIGKKYFSGPASESWDDRRLAGLAAYADDLGAAYRFRRPAITENLLDGLVPPTSSDAHAVLKIVSAGPVAAYFYGEDVAPMPREFGVKKLTFRFADEPRELTFVPEGDLFFSDWRFDIFSPDMRHVLLLQSRFGPYHVVRSDRLKAYLKGTRPPDHIIEATEIGAIHSEAKFIDNRTVEYRRTCCGRSELRRWRMD